jgi:hypothetical protein
MFAHAIRIADEKAPHPVLPTKGDDFLCPLVPEGADLPPFALAHLAPSPLEFAPAPRPLLAVFAFPGQLPKGHVMPSFEGANPAS